MNFTDARKIREIFELLMRSEAAKSRAENRKLTQQLFNGNLPWTPAEAKENFTETNVNFLEGAKILRDARATWHRAFLQPATFFDVRLDVGPPDKRRSWANVITSNMNRIMKRSRRYAECVRSVGAQVVMHGIGPRMWDRQMDWHPVFVAMGDIGIPTNTLCSLENLDHFCIHRRYTPAELHTMSRQEPVDPGWNMKLVNSELRRVAKLAPGSAQLKADYYDQPERLDEEFKQNAGYYGSDAVQTIDVIDFFFKKDDATPWHRRMLLDSKPTGNTDEFLFNPGSRSYAKSIEQLLHVQYGNCANVAPFRWHSVRSLGFMLFAVVHLQNRMRCLQYDDLIRQMQVWFRNGTQIDREQLQTMSMHNFAFFPDNVQIVPANERYGVDHNLVMLGINQNRQLMAENSSSFVQDFSQDEKEGITATETMARVNASTAMVTGMLNDAYDHELWLYREIARRFCVGTSDDCVRFRQDCLAQGIPEQVLNPELWEIIPTRIVGSGNKTLQIAQVDRLMAARNLFPPDAQQIILRMYAEANTDDPGLAMTLVPEADEISDAAHWANVVFGTLMQAIPVLPKRGINLIDYVDTLLALLQREILQIEQAGGMATLEKVKGLETVLDHLLPPPDSGRMGPVQQIEQDPNEKERVKQYGDQIGELANYVKGYRQRIQEMAEQQAAQGGGISAEAMAKIEETRILTEAKAGAQKELSDQKVQQKDIAFVRDQERRDLRAQAEIARAADKAHSEKVVADLDAAASMARDNALTRQELAKQALKGQQELAQAARKAETQAKATKPSRKKPTQ